VNKRKGITSTSVAEGGNYRLSVDTGGTFTDGFVTGRGRTAQVKVDTTPADPTEGLVACVAAAAEAMDESIESFLAQAEVVSFSSTIATNIAVQRTGAVVGLIVTAGHENRLYGSDDEADRLFTFIERDAVQGVVEAVGEDGTVNGAVDSVGLEAAVRALLEHGVHIIVVSLARAYLNPANEVAAKALVEASYPRHYLGAVPLVLSSEISLNRSDYGRTALAVANAYLHPALARSLYRAEDRLRACMLQRPLLIVNTDGSSTRVAKTRAIDTFNSGPSAGVLGAAVVAKVLGAADVVTFDVGGTTTDVAHIAKSQPTRADTTLFGGVHVPHPSIALASFGLGGGSIITASPSGEIVVGPMSAGAVPGPACFGLGGSELTPTDVWLALGYLEPGEFLSGQRHLDPERAEVALERFAEALSLSPEAAALAAMDAIHATLSEEMQTWAKEQAGLIASDPANRWLFSYGGGGGLLAVAAAEALDIERVVVFPQSSVFSAFGGGLLPIAHTYQGSVLDVSDVGAVNVVLTLLAERAVRDMRAEGVHREQEIDAVVTLHDYSDSVSISETTLADLVGDSQPTPVVAPLPSGPGHLTLAIRAIVEIELEANQSYSDDRSSHVREVLLSTGRTRIAVIAGLGRPHADAIEGPAFLAAADTTVFIPENWNVSFNELGYGIARRKN
jgi:N-methylhydantoinase A